MTASTGTFVFAGRPLNERYASTRLRNRVRVAPVGAVAVLLVDRVPGFVGDRVPALSDAGTGTQYGSLGVAYGFDVSGLPVEGSIATPGTFPIWFALVGPLLEPPLARAS